MNKEKLFCPKCLSQGSTNKESSGFYECYKCNAKVSFDKLLNISNIYKSYKSFVEKMESSAVHDTCHRTNIKNWTRTFAFDLNCIFDDMEDINDITQLGEPNQDIVNFMSQLMLSGFFVILYTDKISSENPIPINYQYFVLREELRKRNIPSNAIWQEQGKPHAQWYFDIQAGFRIKDINRYIYLIQHYQDIQELKTKHYINENGEVVKLAFKEDQKSLSKYMYKNVTKYVY